MALFGKKKVANVAKSAPKVAKTSGGTTSRDITAVIIRPIISEKAAVLGDKNVYAFEVSRSATKFDVRAAVQKLWNVTPVKINIVYRAPRKIVLKARNRMSVAAGMKKAYVYLKKDDRIELV